jgi:hypothetical protein
MKFLQLNKMTKIKYLASFYFISIGLLNLLDTLFYGRKFIPRDVIILLILSLPILINKRLFYLGYGIIATLISLIILIVFIELQNPLTAKTTLWYFFSGSVFFLLGVLSSIAFIYIGTYTSQKKRFKLI